jgi:hypothetical protein
MAVKSHNIDKLQVNSYFNKSEKILNCVLVVKKKKLFVVVTSVVNTMFLFFSIDKNKLTGI